MLKWGSVIHFSLILHIFANAIILEYVAFPSPEDLRDLGIEPMSSTLQVGSSPSEPPGKPSKTIGRNKSLLRDRKRLYWLSCMSSNKGATHRLCGQKKWSAIWVCIAGVKRSLFLQDEA